MSSYFGLIAKPPVRIDVICNFTLIRLLLLLHCILFLHPAPADASITNQIQRIEIKQHSTFTRITFKTTEEPVFRIFRLSDNRLRIRFSDTDGILFKTLRQYSDINIGGLLLSRRGNDMMVTFAVATGPIGWRIIHVKGLPSLALDVGPSIDNSNNIAALPGRERIRNGAEKLLKDFDPPINPEIPFVPTDRRALKNLLSDEEQRIFLAAEGDLYKGKLTAAEGVFSRFASSPSQIRPLALYRLAEAQYRLQKYSQALTTFKDADGQWHEFLARNPAVMFYYGDSIARSGDLPGGRQLLARLIANNADKKFAPILLVRMADVLTRQGDEQNANAIYRTVAESFKENKASQIAFMKLADKGFLQVTPDTYSSLGTRYEELADTARDVDLREENTFKRALLESINGPPEKALGLILNYQKKFPKGVYSTVVIDIRKDLVALIYQEKDWEKDPAGLIRLISDNQEYLETTLKFPGFLKAVSTAFDKAGRPLDLISLYASLLDQPGLSDENASYLTLQLADQAELLGDSVLARKVLQSFIFRYPDHAQSHWAQERLGAIRFAAKEFTEVRRGLDWLLEKNAKAAFPISYYYLGRSLWEGKEYPRAAMSMEIYLAAVKVLKPQPPLVGDAYYVAAASYQAAGDLDKAVNLLESGLKVVPAERKDQFTYKLGELAEQRGNLDESRKLYERVIKEGKDPDWQRIAKQALEDSKFRNFGKPSSNRK